MTTAKKIIIGILAIAAFAAGAAMIVFFIIGVPSRGQKITTYKNPQKALLIIDIQEDITGKTAKPPFPYKESEKLITNINELIEQASGQGIKTIYLRQEFSGFFGRIFSKFFVHGIALKNTPGAEIDSRILKLSENDFPKSKGDSFSSQEFEKFLIENQINELYLAGVDGEHCVYLTAQAAVNRGYKTVIIQDAILIRNEPKWAKILNKYKKDGIDILSSKEIFKQP